MTKTKAITHRTAGTSSMSAAFFGRIFLRCVSSHKPRKTSAAAIRPKNPLRLPIWGKINSISTRVPNEIRRFVSLRASINPSARGHTAERNTAKALGSLKVPFIWSISIQKGVFPRERSKKRWANPIRIESAAEIIRANWILSRSLSDRARE